ncbi:MAG: hypothetical protein Kow0025_25440 [Thermodesulfovibrionales bacterium]
MRREGLKAPSPTFDGQDARRPMVADGGFRYNPGAVNWRDAFADRAFRKAMGKEVWTPLVRTGPADYGRPAKVPYEKMPSRTGPTIEELGGDRERLRALYHDAIGGKSAFVETPDGDGIILSDKLFDHIAFDGREKYLSLLRDVAENPYEIWLAPLKGEQTGDIVFRKRFVKFYEEGKGRVMLVGEYQDGCLVGYTFFRGRSASYFENLRRGWLIYGK